MHFRNNSIVNNQSPNITALPACTYFTKHAEDRMKQRGIPRSMVDFLIEFGAVEPDGHHGEKYFFNKRTKKRLRTYLGKELFNKARETLNIYAVVVDGMVITCGHRYKRIRKH